MAARSLKVFTLTVRAISVGWGRQGAFWLLHLAAARGGHSQHQPPRLHVESRVSALAATLLCLYADVVYNRSMGSQIIAAIIAFAAGLFVASLNGWYNQRLENRKHVAQQASAAFVDGAKALANRNQAIAALETMNDPSISERMTWQRWLS